MYSTARAGLTVDENAKMGVLAYRTFRIRFSYDESERLVCLQRILSGYTVEELQEGAEDKYGDKQLHRDFLDFIYTS